MVDFNEIPAEACLSLGGEVEFGDNGADAKSVPIKMRARSGQPINHWFWGRLVHDMAGMKLHKGRLPVDYEHGDPIGYLNKFDASDEGLDVAGALVPTRASGDRTLNLIDLARGGVPFEASINFGGDGLKYEIVGEGQVAEVNGYQFEGPGIVIREWPLRGVAVCPYGADMFTESKFNRAEKFSATPIERAVMADEVKPASDKAEQPAVELQAEANSVEAAEQPAAVETQIAEAPAVDPRAEAKRFRDTFGDKGAVWFAEGREFDACFSQHVKDLETENAELKQRLSAGKVTGEEKPVDFQAGEKPERKGFAGKIRMQGAGK